MVPKARGRKASHVSVLQTALKPLCPYQAVERVLLRFKFEVQHPEIAEILTEQNYRVYTFADIGCLSAATVALPP
jgi:hypothetical protein